MIKRTKSHQDLRFDLPAIGPQTIQTMVSVQASVLAIEAGRTVIIDRENVLSQANEAGISIFGKGHIGLSCQFKRLFYVFCHSLQVV